MTIRPFRPDDATFAAQCAALEGWTTETLEVFAAFFAHDPDGCLIAEEAGRPVGICVATPYDRYGFVGELIVRKEGRGRGVGPRLLLAAIELLKHRGVEDIGLDGVARAVPFYEISGFRPVCESLRFVGRLEGLPQADLPSPGRVRPMSKRDISSVLALDREAFGADRSFFLERLRSRHPELSWVVEDDAGLAGFVLGHPGNGIVAVGPWVVAERWPRPLDILRPLASAAGKRPVRIGILAKNTASVAAVRSLPGMTEQPPSIRMVLGPSDRLGNSPLSWAVGSPAKG
jgi:predicted N-acetyltransferase YhbS